MTPASRKIVLLAVVALVALPVVAAPAALAAPERIAFVRYKQLSGEDAASSIMTMQPNGKKQRTVRKKTVPLVGSTPLFAAAQLSPDGKHLLFGVGVANDKGTIWTSKANGKQAKRIVKLAGNKSVGAPSWSPDGKRIVFVQLNHDSGASSLVVAKANGKGRKTIHTTASGLHIHPAWSPDGKRILFTFSSGFLLPSRVASVKAGGGGRKWLTGPGARCLSGTWSPDGKRVTYTCIQTTRRRGFPPTILFTAKADGKGVKVIDDSGNAASHPAYTPDGKRVMVMRMTGEGSHDLYSKSIKGTGGWKRLTRTTGETFSTFEMSPIYVSFRRVASGKAGGGSRAWLTGADRR